MTLKTPTDFLYGVDERVLTEVLMFDVEDPYQPIGDVNYTLMEGSICGCARNYLDKFQFVAPIVPYGLIVRHRKGFGTKQLLDHVTPDANTSCTYEVAVYKQKKGDKEVLSLGISSDVFNMDVVSYYELGLKHLTKQLPKIDLLGSAMNSARRELKRLVSMDETKSTTIQFLGFLRDGIKKPDYNGAAHLGMPYALVVDDDAVIGYNDDNYQFMGWMNATELTAFMTTQEVMKEMEQEALIKGKVEHHFFSPSLEAKLRPLMDYEFEPWSKALFFDQPIDGCIQNAMHKHHYGQGME